MNPIPNIATDEVHKRPTVPLLRRKLTKASSSKILVEIVDAKSALKLSRFSRPLRYDAWWGTLRRRVLLTPQPVSENNL